LVSKATSPVKRNRRATTRAPCPDEEGRNRGEAPFCKQKGFSPRLSPLSHSPYPSSVSLRSASRRDKSARFSPVSAIRWL